MWNQNNFENKKKLLIRLKRKKSNKIKKLQTNELTSNWDNTGSTFVVAMKSIKIC